MATGNNFPDALTGSVYAAKNQAPIILVGQKLADDEMSYLKNKKMSGATIFGGEVVVSKDIEDQLSQLLNY
ncbi:MAG: hypothetical protein APF81_26660 [Desulfosporosinus sp. BRH_c37]|nr:MAG: hypothetical protein APF81_26660 [Desulfosporosinus sp. BRH_c37]